MIPLTTLTAWYRLLVWVIVLGGLVPSVAYLALYRPPTWRRFLTVDASGWVVVLAAAFGLNLLLLIVGGATAAWTQIVRLLLGLAIDLLVWVRLLQFARGRHRKRKGRDREEVP